MTSPEMNDGPSKDRDSDPKTSAEQLWKNFSSSAREFATTAGRAIRDGAQEAKVKAVEFKDDVSERTDTWLEDATEQLSEAIRSGLEAIGNDPEKQRSFLRELVRVIPVVGGIEGYASSWRLYHKATVEKDTEKQHQACADLWVALVEGGLDLATITGMGGDSKVVKNTVRFADEVSILGRGLRAFGVEKADIVGNSAKKIADTEVGMSIAKSIFELVGSPTPSWEKTEPVSESDLERMQSELQDLVDQMLHDHDEKE